jgi:hypothetical protein
MKPPKLGHILLLGALTVLPGCLAINAALGVFGVFGVVGPPAAQLAGAAYTVAEYSYEYGTNDRMPDEVFLAKFDWLLDGGESVDPAAFAGALSAAVDGPRPADGPYPSPALSDTGNGIDNDAVAVRALPVKSKMAATPGKSAGKAAPERHPAGVPVIAAKPTAGSAGPAPARIVVSRRTVPIHRYVLHAPDPLQTRMNRLESGLVQAETLYLSESADGLRLSMPPCDGDPCAQGVNGGNSLRLRVMRTTPPVPGPPA